jgi:D-beta-D-heptose 7-phosphate kinase/D-beta-D-heptose 1-phosphate adenosyltransferase
MSDPAEIVRSFAGLHALVIGEAMLDRYSSGLGKRLCPEAPVPVVDGCSTVSFAGGAANTAINLRSLGSKVSFLSVTGDDDEADLLRGILQRHDVQCDHLQPTPLRQTLSKHRIFAGTQMMLRFDQGTTAPLCGAIETNLLASLEALIEKVDLVAVSDYAYGILTDDAIRLIRQRPHRDQVVVVDSRRLRQLRSIAPTAVKPNYAEAVEVLGGRASSTNDRAAFMIANQRELLRRTAARMAAVTLDQDGAVLLEAGAAPHRTAAKPCPHSQCAGAGDTYLAALGLALAAGATKAAAADIAAAAAGVVVQKSHTSLCSTEELLAALDGGLRPGDLAGFAAQMERYRQAGRRIVFTNGCFDILHHGHVTYLQRAKSLGDVLVVGVNADESIRKLKGSERPINCLDDRLGVLAGLSCIDHVASFEETTPDRLIRAVRPDIFVKGGDYTRATLPEAELVEELGGRVIILPFLDNHSTSQIVARIRQSATASPLAEVGARTNHALRDLGRRAPSAVR